MDTPEADAWNRMLATLVTGAGAGLGVRGLMGLRNMFRNKSKVDTHSSIPQSVPIRMHRSREEEKFAAEKQAIFDARDDGGMNYWEWPVGVAAGGAGLLGGWSLMDWLMDKRRKSSMGGELSRAKEDYQEALSDQYSSAMMAKGASAEPTLDDVYTHLSDQQRCEAHLEKISGIFPKSWTTAGQDAAHGAGGAYLTALMALTGLSGLGAYKWTRNTSKNKALDKAVRRRRRMRRAPQPVIAVPQYDDEDERGY